MALTGKTSPQTSPQLAAGWVIFFLLLVSLPCRAQFYPGPRPVNPIREAQLLINLTHDTGEDRIVTLTNLANLYAFRSIRATDDSQHASSYVQQAEEACTSRYPQRLYNEIQLVKCNMFLVQNRFDLASRISSRVDDTTRAKLLCSIGYAWMSLEDDHADLNNRTGRAWLEKAAALADSNRNPRLHNLIRLDFGELLLREGKYAESATCLNQVLTKWKTLRYPWLHYVLLELADLYWIQGDYDKALSYTLKALDYVQATNDSVAAGDTYTFLAMIFRNTGQLQKSMDNTSMAIEYYKIYPGHLGSIYYCIQMYGHILFGKKQYGEALEYFRQQYRLYPPHNVGERVQVAADFGDCYLKMKNYLRAERYFLQEFDEKKAAGKLNEEAYHRLAFFYVEIGQYRQALPWLDSAEQRIDAISGVQTKGHLYYMYFLADSATGNYLSAIRYLRANRRCDDTIEDRAKQADIRRLTVEYETNGKNRQIELLQKSNQLYMANQRNADLVRNISVAGILLLGIVAFIFYRQYRNKERMAALINEKNKQLGVLLNEKEWLLKEVHHRVKNNLHTVISLLDIQAEFLKDDALKAIENSQHRIYAMSLIHQKLYAGESLTSINLAAYIGELIGYLKDSFDDGTDLHFKVEVEPLDLDISIAIPVGLIINEVVSNSYKYAFPRRKKGNIIGVVIRKSDSEILIDCWDNGIGLPADALDSRPGSLGLTLIRGLCKEINASLAFGNDNGAWIRIRIPAAFKMNSNPN